jgi:hypothetical protein
LHGTNNNSFGQWYDESKLPYGQQDRAALIQLGALETIRLRDIFGKVTSHNYETIWDSVKPKLTVVS